MRQNLAKPCTLAASVLLVAASGAVWAVEPQQPSRIDLPVLRISPVELSETKVEFESFRPQRLAPRRADIGSRQFYDTHLVPGLTRYFADMGVYKAVPNSGTELGQFALLESLTDAAQYRAQKGTLKAVQQFVLDATAINKLMDTEPARKLASRTSIRRSDLDLSLGIAHGAPDLGIRYRVGNAAFRFSVDIRGLEVQFNHSAATHTWMALTYDSEDDFYGLACRLVF